MGNLADLVRQLATEFHMNSPAVIVRTPAGVYEISANGLGGGPRNRFVISRSQLGSLMWEHGFKRADLATADVAERVAALVLEYSRGVRRGG